MSKPTETAFVTLISEFTGIIKKICRMYRDNPEDRKDLFQEIIFQLWKSYPTFSGKSRLSTWIYRVALNTAMLSFRRKRPVIVYTDALPELPDDDIDEEQLYRQNLLFSMLQELDDGDKALITLYLEDLSYREIAEITGITENYVGVKINRLKITLQQKIKQQHGL